MPILSRHNALWRAASGLAVTSVRARSLKLAAVAVVAMMAINVIMLAAKPDLELGRYLARECEACHTAATTAGTIPNIYGMGEPRFIVLVKAYRQKQMPNPIMQTIAERLKDDEIEALAHYFFVSKKP